MIWHIFISFAPHHHELIRGQQLLTIEMHLKIVPSPLCEPAMTWPLTPLVHEIQDGRAPRDRSFLFLSITQENVKESLIK